MRIREWLWNHDAEVGTNWAFIVATVIFGFIGHVDPALDNNAMEGNTPYSVFWTWLSPYYWQNQPYMFILMIQSLAIYAVTWKLVKMGKISRTMFTMNLAVNTLWMAWTTPQYVLTTIFAPLGTLNPLFIVFEVVLKLPIGWSWTLQDPHVQCGFYGQCGQYIAERFIGLNPSNWGHYITGMMWLLPVVVWYKRNKWRFAKCPLCKCGRSLIRCRCPECVGNVE